MIEAEIGSGLGRTDVYVDADVMNSIGRELQAIFIAVNQAKIELRQWAESIDPDAVPRAIAEFAELFDELYAATAGYGGATFNTAQLQGNVGEDITDLWETIRSYQRTDFDGSARLRDIAADR